MTTYKAVMRPALECASSIWSPCLKIQTENTTSITSTTRTHNLLQHSKAKNTIFNNGRYTTNIPTDPHTVTTDALVYVFVEFWDGDYASQFLLCEIMLLLRAVLNILVRNTSPRGPMCFGCLMFSLSEPCELLIFAPN